jgi:ACS family hexuronate transporter-like MFS transporter
MFRLERKWWVCGLLLLATTINYMDRTTLANAATRVSKEFSLSQEQYGDLEVGFGWAFAAGSLLFGLLADKINVRWLYPAVLLGWSAAGVLSGLVESYNGLLVCRVILGIFEAGHWPCALKTTHALLSDGERTMGNSVLQSGASVGAIVTPPLMLWLMTDDLGSWRQAFVAVGAVGVLWVVLWFVAMPKIESKPVAPKDAVSVWPILGSAKFWAVALLILGAQTCWHLFRVWLPKFLQEGRGYEEAAALKFTSVYYIATDVGCILAGLLSLWLVKKGFSSHLSKRRVYQICCAFTGLAVLIPSLPQGYGLLAVILLVGMGALGLFPCYYSFVQELSSQHVGKLTGLLSMWVWGVTSPMHKYFGRIVDESGSFDQGMVFAGLAPLIGVLALAVLWRQEPSAQQS